jgi:hypothetical protein
MSQVSSRAVTDAVAIISHEERFKAVKRLVYYFAHDPGLISRRDYEALRTALIFLSDGNNDTGVGHRFMDHERAEASAALLKLKLVMRAKLRGDGKPVNLGPEAPGSPAAARPFDPWDSIKLPDEGEENAGI